MRRRVCLAVVFLLLCAAPAQAEGLKVAVFDMQQVVEQCDVLKEATKALEDKYGAQKKSLEQERTAIEKKAQDLAKKKPTQKEQEAFIKEQRDYQQKTQTFLQMIQHDEGQVRKDIETVLAAAAKSYAEKKGYDLLLDKIAVPYHKDALDVTQDMLKEINQVWADSKQAPAQ